MTDTRSTAAVARQGVIGMLQKAVGGTGPKFSMQQVSVTATGRIATGLATVWTGSVHVDVVQPAVNASATVIGDLAGLVAFSGGSVDVTVYRLSSGATSVETSGLAVNVLAMGV
jgi:hypothetical protein